MFDARAVLGIVLYFKEKVLKPLRKDGYLNRCNLPEKKKSSQSGRLFSFFAPQGAGLEPIAEELSDGQFLPPVQKLVATLIFACGKNAYRVLPPQP